MKLPSCLRSALCGWLWGMLVLISPAWVLAVEFDPDKLAQIQGKMQEFVEKQEISGAVTLVGTKDKVVHFEAVGFRDLERQLPMEKGTTFRIASMTKPITAIAIMQLAEQGKLSVDDPVEKHLPEFKGQMMVSARDGEAVTLKKPPRPITIRDLLTHTSGMPGGPPPGLSNLYTRRHLTLAEGVYMFSQRPLDFEPGSKWSYCNSGIDTLGRIIEVVSGASYAEFLSAYIFQRVGAHQTAIHREDPDSIAVVYDKKDGKLMATQNVIIGSSRNARYPIPAGGLLSNARDLATLYQHMLPPTAAAVGDGGDGAKIVRRSGPALLTNQSIAEMTRVQTGELVCGFTPGMSFGYGWAVVKEPQGVTEMLSPGTFGHGGAFGTQGWIDPKKGVFVILLIQRIGLANADASDIRREFQKLAFEAIK